VIDVASGDRTILTEGLDRTAAPYPMVRAPIWDGDRIVFPIENEGRVPIYAVPADGSDAPALIADVAGLTGFDLVGGTLVHGETTPTMLAEVRVGERRLTDVGAAFSDEVPLGEPEAFTAVSPDGTEVPAWIVRPPGFDPNETYPAVLSIHGGPFTQYGERFFDEFQVYAGAGYVVLYANPRGSSGYSEDWGRAIRGPVGNAGPGWGSVDYDDLMAVTDEAIKRFGFIDAERMAVMGGSYGGYMTSWIVGHTDRFRCAISERAVNDIASEDGSSDIGGFFKGYIGAYPWDAPEVYRAISPLTYAAQITTPLLILHSEEDLRCPINQGEQLFTMLRALGREVEFVRFPAESHELTRSGSPTHRVQRFELILEFLGKHLRD
jgi:dipeptidyl aminopeptidase/acylaminoacyl peptidase